MKTSIVLFELILSIVIISIIGVYSVVFLQQIHEQTQNNSEQNQLKMQLFSAHNILKNRAQNGLSTELTLNHKKLYLEGNIFLDNVSRFSSSTPMTICLGEDELMCQSIDLR